MLKLILIYSYQSNTQFTQVGCSEKVDAKCPWLYNNQFCKSLISSILFCRKLLILLGDENDSVVVRIVNQCSYKLSKHGVKIILWIPLGSYPDSFSFNFLVFFTSLLSQRSTNQVLNSGTIWQHLFLITRLLENQVFLNKFEISLTTPRQFLIKQH